MLWALLHSAAMVKAGVLLIAVLGPAFEHVAVWKWLGIAFGVSSMLWGAIGALRHRDAKLILAWGTVSQLGLMVALLSVGTEKALLAAVSLLFSHALFKAALFLLVGEVDIRAGTRDIGELGGLSRSMPVAVVVALLAGGAIALLAGAGVLRFSTPYARFHSAGKASPTAFLVAAAGACIELGFGGAVLLVIAAVAMTLTLPLGAHLLFRAVHRTTSNEHLVVNEYSGAEETD